MQRSFYDLLQTVANLRFPCVRNHQDDPSSSPPPSLQLSQSDSCGSPDVTGLEALSSEGGACSASMSASDRADCPCRRPRERDSAADSIWTLRPGSLISERDADELTAISQLLRRRFEREGRRLGTQADAARTAAADERSPLSEPSLFFAPRRLPSPVGQSASSSLSDIYAPWKRAVDEPYFGELMSCFRRRHNLRRRREATQHAACAGGISQRAGWSAGGEFRICTNRSGLNPAGVTEGT